ncbi:hypothetical protein HMSSN036_86400 [Paenibacillus macerans]|nr:hypothetical protein HMSSN036_86400 [Paenibacillus macerans]
MIGTTNELWRCKTLFLIVLGALLVWLIPQVSLAEGADGGWIKRQAEELPTDQVETYWQQLMKDYGGFFRIRSSRPLWICCLRKIKASA